VHDPCMSKAFEEGKILRSSDGYHSNLNGMVAEGLVETFCIDTKQGSLYFVHLSEASLLIVVPCFMIPQNTILHPEPIPISSASCHLVLPVLASKTHLLVNNELPSHRVESSSNSNADDDSERDQLRRDFLESP